MGKLRGVGDDGIMPPGIGDLNAGKADGPCQRLQGLLCLRIRQNGRACVSMPQKSMLL